MSALQFRLGANRAPPFQLRAIPAWIHLRFKYLINKIPKKERAAN
jgi:hypothetical protein